MPEDPTRWDAEPLRTDGGSGDEGWGSPMPAKYGSLTSHRREDGVGGPQRPPAGIRGLLRRSRGSVPLTRRPVVGDGAVNRAELETNGAAGSTSAPTRWVDAAAPAPSGARTPQHRRRPVPEPAYVPPSEAPPRTGRGDAPVTAPPPRPGFPRLDTGRTVTHVSVTSVAKVSIVFYLIVVVIVVVASMLLWLVADVFGAVTSLQKSIRSLFDLKSFVLHPYTIAMYASAAGAVLAVAGTIANVIGVVMYNLISELVGGIQVWVSEAEE